MEANDLECDELEVTREELVKMIQDRVNCRLLQTPAILAKQSTLITLWNEKEKLYTDLYKLFEEVSKCEGTIRQLYKKLGWQYKDLQDGNDCASNCGSSCEQTDDEDENQNHSLALSDIPIVVVKEENINYMTENKFELKKELRVLLNRLPRQLRPRKPAPPQPPKRELSDDELSNADSDYEPQAVEPSDSDSDSDFSFSSDKSGRHKRKKLRKNEKTARGRVVPQAALFQPQAAIVRPASNASTSSGSCVSQERRREEKRLVVTEQVKKKDDQPPLLGDICIGMSVLARRKQMRWECGTISEIVEKDDGTKKYKVIFEDKGKVLVSGHHIAYDGVPKLSSLTPCVRVVAKCKTGNTFYSPGILAELPSRKNHMRFLIFFDDHQCLYVALPVIRLVYNPLPEPLDDIRDEEHKKFMKEYVERMPYPPQTQFREGQVIKVRHNGELKSCTVVRLDSSLMEIEYDDEDYKEWIYRGSMKLEHMIIARENLRLQQLQQQQ
ncbi:unnamed protein product [Knipowitschia caucasica]